MLHVLDLFSGIGGFSLGLERTGGFKTDAFCEIEPFCQKVLDKHWPDVPIFQDIKKLTGEDINEIGKFDVVCGGFPCQPVSIAGKRCGKNDSRWMWPDFYRIICEVEPTWVLVENVPGLLSADSGRLFAGILRDLAESGYDAEWQILRACDFGLPHRRERLYLVANTNRGNGDRRPESGNWGTNGSDLHGPERNVANSNSKKLEERNWIFATQKPFPTVDRCDWGKAPSSICRMDDVVSNRVDRLRALGNAIVPQCAEFVGRCVLDYIETCEPKPLR